ncbi:MAG: DNA translocase FtsK, partial [Clostridia bacterium]|nr:DNA translocase FtsK [Clostridia bacterium]
PAPGKEMAAEKSKKPARDIIDIPVETPDEVEQQPARKHRWFGKGDDAPPVRTYEMPKPQKDTKALGKNTATYQYPPLDLLVPGTAAVRDEETEAEIERNSEALVETLASFNVGTHIVGISRGPRITRYEIMPNRGVKVNAITSRADDIALNLASAGIRIEAPIPGMSAIGVEVPNRKPTLVRIRDMFASEGFATAPSKSTVCLGTDVTGNPVFADIAKMPHLLIAGATGMGKSVCINGILLSLLYKARPDEVKLILVDPKKVELNVYNNIPHLLVPVVTDAQAAAGALIWAVGEMERRFELIESMGVRDLKSYNNAVAGHPDKGEPLPKIIIVIDELNDLMMSAKDAVESAICRIAQKARAAGMHLIIGTQRPSVDVITGVIKANIPSRIAFHVSSMVDSRTILDMTGAEKLLDKGDMLASLVGLSEPRRVQGSMVEDEEVERVTSFLKTNAAKNGTVYDDEVMESMRHETEKYKQSTQKRGDHDDDGELGDDIWDDGKFCQAVELAIRSGKISTSLIQRKLSLGYGKAAKYIDAMERLGIVSEPDGQKPRDVLITMEDYELMRARAN